MALIHWKSITSCFNTASGMYALQQRVNSYVMNSATVSKFQYRKRYVRVATSSAGSMTCCKVPKPFQYRKRYVRVATDEQQKNYEQFNKGFNTASGMYALQLPVHLQMTSLYRFQYRKRYVRIATKKVTKATLEAENNARFNTASGMYALQQQCFDNFVEKA